MTETLIPLTRVPVADGIVILIVLAAFGAFIWDMWREYERGKGKTDEGEDDNTCN